MMSVTLSNRQGWWSLPQGRLMLGRDRGCTICLDDPRLSRKHAAFTLADGEATVEDLGSSNGVHVNGDRISVPTSLRHGDLVTIGPFTFEVKVDADEDIPDELTGSLVPEGKDGESEFMPSTDRQMRMTEGMDYEVEVEPEANNSSLNDNPLTPNPAELAKAAGKAPKKAQTNGQPTPVPAEEGTDHAHAASTIAEDPLSALKPSPIKQEKPAAKEPPPEKDSEALKPQTKRQTTNVLLPNDPSSRLRIEMQVIRGRRLMAGLADGLTSQALAWGAAIPLTLGGYLFAMHQAGAGIVEAVPVLDPEIDAASISAHLMALTNPKSWAVLPDLLSQLRGDHRQSFMIFFIGITAGILAWVLINTLYLVAATAVKGAPFWHRRMELVIREQSTGYFPTAVRALARWVLAGLTAPAALVSILITRRSLHDLVVNCSVRRRDSPSTSGPR